MSHVVLLGDSIFDNGVYVPDGRAEDRAVLRNLLLGTDVPGNVVQVHV